MRSLNKFVVELKKRLNDTMTLDNGVELYVDTKYNEFQHRVTEGPIVAVPARHETGAKPGDTLYFHHLVVVNGGQVLTRDDDHYLVHYHPEAATESQAIAYKGEDGLQLLGGWGLLEPVEEVKEKESESIELVKLKEDKVTKGRVAFMAPWIEELGVRVGDVVGIPRNMDYRIKIDGKEYYRTRAQDFLYVYES
jgi:co-chaperonin GroES (HSP10)